MRFFRLAFIMIFLTLHISFTYAQQAFTFGSGISMLFQNSKDLKLFRNTYNYINMDNTSTPLQGFNSPMGIRYEVGYRSVNVLSVAFLVGMQSYTSKDFAQYGRGEARDLSYKLKSTFIEIEAGRRVHKRFFFNGLINFYLNRKSKIESVYTGRNLEASKKSLTGTYRSDPHFSMDIGLAFGAYKEPLFFILKVYYPIYTGGINDALFDSSDEKDAFNYRTRVFPKDYIDYYYGGPIRGVRSNIDGLKISFTVCFAIPIKLR